MLIDLQHNIERIVNGINADWSIYIKFLASGDEIALNADVSMDTMSVIKIPLLVTLYRELDAGRIHLDERIVLEARHKRFGTGVLQNLDDGLTLTLQDVGMLMIILSDNTATDLCFERVGGPKKVNETMFQLGLPSIHASGVAFDWFRGLSSFMDPAYAKLSPEEMFKKGYPQLPPEELAIVREKFHFSGSHPFALAHIRDIGKLLEMIWQDECASQTSCGAMRGILRLQQYRTRIPKYLFGATVAHKTGDFDPFIANDVGVIEPFGRPPIIACFFACHHRGIWANLEEAIARMSEKVWEYGLHLDRASGANPWQA
jgi:beta-lactamase class A